LLRNPLGEIEQRDWQICGRIIGQQAAYFFESRGFESLRRTAGERNDRALEQGSPERNKHELPDAQTSLKPGGNEVGERAFYMARNNDIRVESFSFMRCC